MSNLQRLEGLLACPLHRQPLAVGPQDCACPTGCIYPVVNGIPVLIPSDLQHYTHANAANSLAAATSAEQSGSLDTSPRRDDAPIDPYVSEMVAHTNSLLYRHMVGRIDYYPIPDIAVPPAVKGARLLDIGCGWGRWSFAAARKGYFSVGIDTSLESAAAAVRVARELELDAAFLVADARYLPFVANAFDVVYSFSVLQHFSKRDVYRVLRSVHRVARPGGLSYLHLLNAFGLRGLQVMASRLGRPARGFETRYWTPTELAAVFDRFLGQTTLVADTFFVQGRYSDRAIFRPHHRAIVELSHLLIRVTKAFPPLRHLADNIFCVSRIA